MPRGSGSVDNAPDSYWTNASSKLERRKYYFITSVYFKFQAHISLGFTIFTIFLGIHVLIYCMYYVRQSNDIIKRCNGCDCGDKMKEEKILFAWTNQKGHVNA